MEGTSGDPTTANSKSSETGAYGTGTYNRSVSGLSSNTSYRVRAFAVNSAGTGYGTSTTIKTLALTGNSERNVYIVGKSTGNSERGLYINGVLPSGSSERNIWVQGKAGSSSERGLYLEGVTIDSVYSRESLVALPANDTNLVTVFSEQDYEDVVTDDDTYVDLKGTSRYFKYLFKEYNEGEKVEQFVITWKGKSTKAPSNSTVYLQVFNRDSSEWETLSSNDSTNANTKFTLSGSKTSDLENYYDGDYIISVRIYQDGN
jgi:hypothetical protein